MIKAIIFDFDGVIHDTLTIAYSINNKLMPDVTLEAYKDFFNGNIYEHTDIPKENYKKYFEMQHLEYEHLLVKGSIKKTIKTLSKKFKLFIISSNQEKTINMYFKNNSMQNIFSEILGFETHKSKEKKFRMILDKYQLKKDEIIFVTDTLGDIIEANKVGILTIAVDFGFHGKERLKIGKPAKIISKFTELLEAVESF